MVVTKKDYIHLIRWSCILDAFITYYFIRIVVLYLLSKNVTPWVAVSIPIVLEFAALISRGFRSVVQLALKVNYKKYHIFHFIVFLILGIIVCQCRSVYTIYTFIMLAGFLTGIKDSSVTKLNTSNKEYESYCFMEEERAKVIGRTLGLIVSQYVYDISPTLYIIGYFILIVLGTILNLFLRNITVHDEMIPIEEEILDKKDKQNTILVASLFGILAGFWCMGWSAFTELAPLISNKIGYLEAIYTMLEIILLCIVSGTLLKKIKNKKKLLYTETIIAIIDVLCLLIASITLSWSGLLIAYIITGFSSTLGDPIWGSIVSAYSVNSRKKYILVNRVYFIIRAIFTILTWIVCRECVIRGIGLFKYLSIILIVFIILIYIIADKVNKKVFGSSI